MRHTWIRGIAGACALAVAVALGRGDAADVVPASAAEKAVAADAAHLKTLFEMAKMKKKLEGRTKATAMLIATYAQDQLAGKDADKMAALRAQALKVAEAMAKKDVAGAKTAAEGLDGVKANAAADKKPLKLASMHKIDLHDIMDLFGGKNGGGMNIEFDIRAAKKEGVKDTAAAEVLATRTAAIADFTLNLPPDFGGKKTKADWEKWAKEMKTISVDLAGEAGKGAKADMAKLKKLVSSLDANCTNCHNVFRDD